MSDSPEEKLTDHMYIIYDAPTGQVTQVKYETAAHGLWTRIQGEWRELALEDESEDFMERREIAGKNYLETRDYFDDQTEQKILTYEPEYRMWFA